MLLPWTAGAEDARNEQFLQAGSGRQSLCWWKDCSYQAEFHWSGSVCVTLDELLVLFLGLRLSFCAEVRLHDLYLQSLPKDLWCLFMF